METFSALLAMEHSSAILNDVIWPVYVIRIDNQINQEVDIFSSISTVSTGGLAPESARASAGTAMKNMGLANIIKYRKVSNIRRTKSHNLNASRVIF